jgi:hypothetical protein
MERVGILINKLQEQLNAKADAKSMLVTTQMLNSELLQSLKQTNGYEASIVSVMMPHNYVAPVAAENKADENLHLTKPEVIHVETFAIEETSERELVPLELVEEAKPEQVAVEEPVKRDHSSWIFDPIEAPTLAHQEKIIYELNDSMVGEEATVNDRLKVEKAEVAHVLHEVPIRDLKKAITINDRHRFIEDLFRGDETMYERSIKTINNFNNYAEAEFWMQRELKLKLAWDNNSSQVKLFDQLVRRRFA